MTLYMIGLGLGDEKDISIKGLEIVKRCKKVFLEIYTSKLSIFGNNNGIDKLEEFYGKKIIVADREMVEKRSEEILIDAKEGDVAFLVVGDAFGATTHTDIRLRANEKRIDVKVVHNASIVNAIGEVGLELYKFGKITTIPLDNENIKSPIQAIEKNKKNGMHTLVLFDIKAEEEKLMNANEAIAYLLREGFSGEDKVVVCSKIGSDDRKIIYGKLNELKDMKFDKYPQCLIVPGELHFMEEEALKLWE